MIIGFVGCFYLKNVVLWAVTIVLSGVMAMSSFSVEKVLYIWNSTLTAYQPTVISNSYPYIATINIMIFALALIFGIYDIFTQHNGIKKQKQDSESF
jgi:hypothetical protein